MPSITLELFWTDIGTIHDVLLNYVFFCVLQNKLKYINFVLFKDWMKPGSSMQVMLVSLQYCCKVYNNVVCWTGADWIWYSFECRVTWRKGSRHQIKFKVMILIRFTHLYIRFIWSRGEKAAMLAHVMLL